MKNAGIQQRHRQERDRAVLPITKTNSKWGAAIGSRVMRSGQDVRGNVHKGR